MGKTDFAAESSWHNGQGAKLDRSVAFRSRTEVHAKWMQITVEKVISGLPWGPVLGQLSPIIVVVNTIENGTDSKVLKFAVDVKVLRAVESGQDQDVKKLTWTRCLNGQRIG